MDIGISAIDRFEVRFDSEVSAMRYGKSSTGRYDTIAEKDLPSSLRLPSLGNDSRQVEPCEMRKPGTEMVKPESNQRGLLLLQLLIQIERLLSIEVHYVNQTRNIRQAHTAALH